MTGKQLKAIRKRMKLTQTEFAKLLFYKTYHSIQSMEVGRTIIPDYVEATVKQFKTTN